jgi:hypothetical protein
MMAVIWGIVVATAVLVAVNAYLQLRDRARLKRQAKDNPRELAKQVVATAHAFGLGVQKVEARSGEDFRFIITGDGGAKPITILKATDSPIVTFAAAVKLSEAHKQALGAKGKQLEVELTLALAQLGIGWKAEEQNGQLVQVELQDHVVFGPTIGGLAFLRSLTLIERGMGLFTAVVRKLADYK